MNNSADSRPLTADPVTGTPAITVTNLVRDFGRFRLGPLDLSIPVGYITGLVGANGAGKTTLLKLLLGLQTPDAGELSLLGHPVGDDNVAVREDIGVVLDAPFVLPDWTIGNAGRALAPFYSRWDTALFGRLLNRFHLEPSAQVKSLSRGESTKLMLALAMAHQPRLLLLDEPTSGLDPATRRDLLDLFAEFMAADPSHTILFSTHLTSDLERIADHLRVLSHGRLVEAGTLDEVVERYAIARGPRRALTPQNRALIYGLHERADIFDGLIAAADTAGFGVEVVIDPATLDDIVVHLSTTAEDVPL
ncbi:ABC transporter ATP-binding protein [Propionicimonas sp.]|uniref:ABC transporter ATP-binding protein n=1 Tax=Propionicimonas sp. TaxID=1955623 RepID=UPI00184FC825|nr:ABC transporter ATP-binding protein [Propionicimonas sp.]MBU3976421.1 ABC transporter ATP-binding protein [Actinomycetota bacterium]MBA3021987.1 ABC transporter ATP-binding protein [Propionicimonas sp.]MBU3987578.1 ABC transporter ATP-binding protein [Actinomycetota bacterium]MBU4006477.1 ABC transporter ATP-binding protein [Actinomycetota bacterium]MBU4065082.1 ABC transporter ATP-binding protein [Actinomycetota bacterium]